MVEFHDPIQNIQLSYHLDLHLKKKWDTLRNGELVKKDADKVYLVDGREGSGKSTFAFQQAKYLDHTFDVDRVCFTPEEFLNQIRTAKKGSVIVFDEAFRGLSSKATQSKVNKTIVQAMMEMRQRNLIIFIVLPTFFLLEMYAACLRSQALFHVWQDKNGVRRFRIYNYNQKLLLYQHGKRGFSYAWPRVKVRGRFFGQYAINREAYLKKKHASFMSESSSEEQPENRFVQQRRVALWYWYLALKKYEKMTQKQFCDMLLTQHGIDIDWERLRHLGMELRKIRQNGRLEVDIYRRNIGYTKNQKSEPIMDGDDSFEDELLSDVAKNDQEIEEDG